MDECVQFGSRYYWVFFNVLVVGRGTDLLSTWLATPHLALEANPIARRLGWKWGLPLNVVLCGAFAAWPLPAVIIATTSILVAARNFQGVWLMRTLGEEAYRQWMGERICETRPALYLGCLLAQTGLVGGVGGALILSSLSNNWIAFGIGVGIVAYALAVLLFTLLSVWRLRRSTSRMAGDILGE